MLYMFRMYTELPVYIQEHLPQIEPRPEGEFVYKVAEPFYTADSVSLVCRGLLEGEISSASIWPKLLGERIAEYLAISAVFPTSSGFSALVAALVTAEVGRGDEVIIPSFTMIAVRNAVKFVGATPVYVDNSPGKLNPSMHEISAAVTSRTKAVIVSHTYGESVAAIDRLAIFCDDRKFLLIEDVAESFGARSGDRKLGSFGNFVCGSFYANKNLTAGDGGFVGTRNHKFSEKLKSVINHGFNPKFHFVHFFTAPNAKANGLGCALALGSMASLDLVMQRRTNIFRLYKNHLSIIANLQILHISDPWVVPVLVKDKNTKQIARSVLAEIFSIETRSFFFPIHLQPCVWLEEGPTESGTLPVCVDFYDRGFYLPLHPYLEDSDVRFICQALAAALAREQGPKPVRKPGWVKDVRRNEIGAIDSIFRDL